MILLIAAFLCAFVPLCLMTNQFSGFIRAWNLSKPFKTNLRELFKSCGGRS